jgi:hypothetical protein
MTHVSQSALDNLNNVSTFTNTNNNNYNKYLGKESMSDIAEEHAGLTSASNNNNNNDDGPAEGTSLTNNDLNSIQKEY